MRRYETIVIVDPDLGEDNRSSMLDRIKEIIPQQDGVLLKEDIWGNKKLAYEIKKRPRGFYVRYDYCGMGPVVDELERSFRIDDRVLKYLTVQLDDDADAQKILAEMAAQEQAEASPSDDAAQPPDASVDSRQTAEAAPENAEAAPENAEAAPENAEAKPEPEAIEAEATEPATENSEKE